MRKKQHCITLSVDAKSKANLERLAMEFDCLWGEQPNVSKLIQQIADEEISLEKNGKVSKKRALLKDAIARIQDALSILLELI